MYSISKINSLKSAVPIFLKDNLVYLRKEKKDFLSFYSNCGYTNELIMNNTSLMILKLCDSVRTVDHIVEHIYSMYPTVSREKIFNDVCQTLLNFEKIQLIEWKEGNPIMMYDPITVSEKYNLQVASEIDIRDIFHFLSIDHSNSDIVFWGQSVPSNFNKEINIRYHLFSRKGDYFLIKNYEQKICGIIFIAIGNQIRNPVGYIEFCICPKEIFTACLKQAIPIFKDIAIKPVSKIEIVIPSDFKEYDLIRQELLLTGFNQEAVLRGEIASGIDASIFSYFLEE